MSHISLHVHIVFAVKNRVPLIREDWRSRLHDYFGGILKREGGVLLSVGGMPDHMHLLVSLNADRAISDIMRAAKAGSSKWIHDTFPDSAMFAWQEGYGLFSVSRSHLERVREYIEDQAEHHRKITFREEFIGLLKKHNLPYDERFL